MQSCIRKGFAWLGRRLLTMHARSTSMMLGLTWLAQLVRTLRGRYEQSFLRRTTQHVRAGQHLLAVALMLL
eukprot:4125490-Amphidinium_carterae.1